MENQYSISVIVPVYNEVELLEKSIYKIDYFLNNNFKDYEIIIIESGSVDDSLEVCVKLSKELTRVKLIQEGSRKGFGSALKLGYKIASKDLIWLITVDLPFPLEAIFSALPLFSKYDCVLSYRFKDNRKVARKIQSFVYNAIVKLVLELKVRHVNSAFKVFKSSVLKNMTIISNGWFIDTEIIYRLRKKRISFAEIPVELIDRSFGNSSTNLFTFVSVLKELIYFIKNK